MTRKWLSKIGNLLFGLFLIYFITRGSDRAFDNLGDSGWLWWGILGMITLIALLQFATTLSILSNVGGAKSRRPQDITAENRPPTPNAARLIAELNMMGFTRFGETLTIVPLMGKGVTWILVSPDKHDSAEVVDIGRGMPAMVQFSTVFLDEAVLETSHPIGEDQDFPLFRARYNTQSIPAAYQQHLTERAAMQIEHGSPRTYSNMLSYQAWDIRYRELHVRNRLGRPVLPSILMSLWFVVLLALFAFIAVANENPDLFSRDLQYIVMTVGAILLVGGGLIVLALHKKEFAIAADVNAAKTKEAQSTQFPPPPQPLQ